MDIFLRIVTFKTSCASDIIQRPHIYTFYFKKMNSRRKILMCFTCKHVPFSRNNIKFSPFLTIIPSSNNKTILLQELTSDIFTEISNRSCVHIY